MTTAKDVTIWHCNGSGSNGRGIYNEEGFVVLKGSSGRLENAPSIGRTGKKTRTRLVETGVARVEGDQIHFEKDYLFGSPSWAALAIMGRKANGWKEWKTDNGKTMDEVLRRSK